MEIGEGTLAFDCSTVSPHVGEPGSPGTSWVSRRTSHPPRRGSRDLDIAARWRETSPISCSNPKSTMGSHDRRAISTSPLPRTQSPPVGPPEIPGQARDDHTNGTAAGGNTGTAGDPGTGPGRPPRTESPPVATPGSPEIPGQARDDHAERTAAGRTQLARPWDGRDPGTTTRTNSPPVGTPGRAEDDHADGLTAAGPPSVIPGLPRDLLLDPSGCASGRRSR